MPRSGRSRSRGPRSASVGVSVASPASAFELDYERKIANFLATAPGQEISLRGVGKVWPRGAVGRLIAFLQARPHRFAVVPGENATVRLLSRSDCGRQNDGNGRTAAPPAPAAAPASAAAAAAAEYALALIAALREAEAAGAGPDGDGALKLCQLGEVCLKPPGVAGSLKVFLQGRPELFRVTLVPGANVSEARVALATASALPQSPAPAPAAPACSNSVPADAAAAAAAWWALSRIERFERAWADAIRGAPGGTLTLSAAEELSRAAAVGSNDGSLLYVALVRPQHFVVRTDRAVSLTTAGWALPPPLPGAGGATQGKENERPTAANAQQQGHKQRNAALSALRAALPPATQPQRAPAAPSPALLGDRWPPLSAAGSSPVQVAFAPLPKPPPPHKPAVPPPRPPAAPATIATAAAIDASSSSPEVQELERTLVQTFYDSAEDKLTFRALCYFAKMGEGLLEQLEDFVWDSPHLFKVLGMGRGAVVALTAQGRALLRDVLGSTEQPPASAPPSQAQQQAAQPATAARLSPPLPPPPPARPPLAQLLSTSASSNRGPTPPPAVKLQPPKPQPPPPRPAPSAHPAATTLYAEPVAFEILLPPECADEPATAPAFGAGGGRLSVRWANAETLVEDLQWLLHEGESDNESIGAGAPAPDAALLSPPGLPCGLCALLGVGVEGHSDLVQLSSGHRAVLFRIKPLLPLPQPQPASAVPQQQVANNARALRFLVEDLLYDETVGKVGVELLRHAAALLHDSRGAACVRGGIDVGEALAVETDSGRTHNLILVRAFNAAFGTALRPDPALASSDWAAPRLSQAQLAHAAMNAFMAWALGAARGCALLRHEDRRTVCVPAPPSQLLNVCPMLRECEAALRGEAKASEVELHSAEVVEGAADRGNTGLGNELRLHMARYETKVRRMDEVEVIYYPAPQQRPGTADGTDTSTSAAAGGCDLTPSRGKPSQATLERLDGGLQLWRGTVCSVSGRTAMVRSSLMERTERARENNNNNAAAAGGGRVGGETAGQRRAWRASARDLPLGAEVVSVRLVKSEDRQTRAVEAALLRAFSAEAQQQGGEGLPFAARFLYEPRVPPAPPKRLAAAAAAAGFGAAALTDWREGALLGACGTPPQMPPLELPPGKAMPWALNEGQRACVAGIVGGDRLTLTLGPPGTGKTTCIAAAAWALSEHAPRADVVVLAQQNVAAMNVLRAVVRGGFTDVRLVISRDYYHEWHEHEYAEDLQRFLHVHCPSAAEAERLRLPQSPAHRAVTVLTFGMAPAVRSDPAAAAVAGATAVLIDEASQVWGALGLLLGEWFPKLQRLHLFGDDRQLPPSVNTGDPGTQAVSAGVRSVYDWARDNGHAQYQLTVQHRMPAQLAEFISEHVYGGLLRSHPAVSAAVDAVVWVDCPRGACRVRRGTTSLENADEADAVAELMRWLDSQESAPSREGGPTRVVLTPYAAQRGLIESRAGAASAAKGGSWDVKTVDSFQGREADIVIISLVKSSNKQRGGGGGGGGGGAAAKPRGAGLSVLKAGFIGDVRRANVLLTRAVQRMVIVGDAEAWLGSDSELWRAFAERFGAREAAAESAREAAEAAAEAEVKLLG